MADGQTIPISNDPYAEFGGKSISTSAADPYAEFGGRTIPPPLNLGPSTNQSLPMAETINPGQVMKGIGEGAVQTAVGAGELAKKVGIPGANFIPDSVLQKGRDIAKPESMGEQGGKILEEGIEWTVGEGALVDSLKTLGKVAHFSPEIMELIEKSPTASKTILGLLKQTGVQAAKGAAIGGAQGAVKAAGEGESVKEGAESGAEGGALGSIAAELGIAGLKKGGEAVGLGRESLAEATRSGKPGKWNTRWEEDWNRALPKLVERYPEIKGKGVEGVADSALDASNDLWTKEVRPLIDAHVGDTKNTTPVADAVRKRITASLTKLNPDRAKAMEDFANLYSGPKSMMSIGDMEADIEHLNADLASEGWWKKTASEREAAIKSGQEEGMKSVAADELRNQVYSHIESFKGPNGEPSPITELKKTYGSLRNIEHEFRGQVNVQNRQAAVSLKKIIGMTAGAAAGGPLGWASAAIPYVDAAVNSPDRMAERAIRSGKPESAAAKITKKVAGKTARAAAGVTGEHAAKWIQFKGGDGQDYEHHPDHSLEEIQQADPGASYPQ